MAISRDYLKAVNDTVIGRLKVGIDSATTECKAKIKANGWPMVMNVVLHRLNIDHIDRIIEMAESRLGGSSLCAWQRGEKARTAKLNLSSRELRVII